MATIYQHMIEHSYLTKDSELLTAVYFTDSKTEADLLEAMLNRSEVTRWVRRSRGEFQVVLPFGTVEGR